MKLSQESLSELNASDDDGESSSQAGDNHSAAPLDEQQSSNGDNGAGGSSTAGTSQRTDDDDAQTVREVLSKKETKHVFRLRLLFIFMFVAAATSISLTVYYLTKDNEMDEFESQYYDVATSFIAHFQEIMLEMSSICGLAVAATTDAELQKELIALSQDSQAIAQADWPFVTMPHFQERAGNVRFLSGVIYVSVCPIVQDSQFAEWESYVQGPANVWIDEGLALQESQGLNDFDDPEVTALSWLTNDKVDPLHSFDSQGVPHRSESQSGPFLPRWQASPVLATSIVNENLMENPHLTDIIMKCIDTKSAVLGGFVTAPPGNVANSNPDTSFFATLLSMWEGKEVDYLGDPMSYLVLPIFDTMDGVDRKVVAVLKSTIHWGWYLDDVLTATNHGVTIVLENACDGNYTYSLVGTEAHTVGFGDRHDPEYSEYHYSASINIEVIEDGTFNGIPFYQENCPYSFHVFATPEDQEAHTSKDPVIICVVVATVFLFTIALFVSYDIFVERRQRRLLAKATQSSAIVSSLFPKQIRDRLMAMESDKRKGNTMLAPNHRLKTFLDGNIGDEGDQPIADFFPHCTVMFADIAGFTAWSSTREPSQVFVLLQTVYQNFDFIAKKRRVFKVETIGDSYLAVTGLPEPQSNHASIMARFAWDCLLRMAEITKELEVTLGPDTGDLSMRFGIHSGSVTAGVLKGDRARFQLFGDTVNTAARMESTGMNGRIQVSEVTARLLKKSGKEGWLTQRDDSVKVKGKGILKTYWLTVNGGLQTRSNMSDQGEDQEDEERVQILKPSNVDLDKRHHMKETRLVDWVADILLEHIKKVVIVHQRCMLQPTIRQRLHYEPPEGKNCLDEVKAAINMPVFDAKVIDAALDSNMIEVPDDILDSLRAYVADIAKSYHENPFHNFEHACHVTMSVNKLLSRIVAPDLATPDKSNHRREKDEVAAEIHNFTHGITSDPMAVFAIVFSALIHDVDHRGISNAQLAKEIPEMGKLYRNKSLAEQNSLDVAWGILMSDRFDRLREYIFLSRSEMMRFRQLIVNIVLATDIFDKELGELRKDRWEQAFHGDGNLPTTRVNDMRATIVMEHIIQASDVSHTMQHWHVYQKWNRNLFRELYRAWKAGRMGADPGTFWYKGELGFFDNYIIPLAKKLRECNVFGVSSDEYLGYALRNRAEWEDRGELIVKTMTQEIEEEETSAENLASCGTAIVSEHDRSVDNTASVQSQSSSTPQEESPPVDKINHVITGPPSVSSGRIRGYQTPNETQSFDESLNSSSPQPKESQLVDEKAAAPDRSICVVQDTRLVNMVVDLLLMRVKAVVVAHKHLFGAQRTLAEAKDLRYDYPEGMICIDEFKDFIPMSALNSNMADAVVETNPFEVPYEIVQSLRDLVTEIAKSYHCNAFHNFEHACKVTRNASELLNQIVVPEQQSTPPTFADRLKSDPLVAMAMVFAALIHDIDHQGISNVQLAKEEPHLGGHYRHKSVAEQNALDVGWDIFMSDRFDRLRQYVFVSREELMRFRQVAVNAVLATDIFDKEQNQLRKDRWQKAFNFSGTDDSSTLPEHSADIEDMRATVVMELIIQASNVGHTFIEQSFEEYRSWNSKLFFELNKAFADGRMQADPKSFWFKGEIAFFDFFVLPMLSKLNKCHVFGAKKGEDYLEYALKNQAEWKTQGEQIVKVMIKNEERPHKQ